MTSWTALLLGLAVVGILVAYNARPVVLILLAVACFMGAMISFWLAAASANDEVGTSWSDSGPQLMLRWAATCVLVGVTSLLALAWPRLWRRNRDRR